MSKRKHDHSEEAAALRSALEEILRQASRRFEGQSCERCLAIEAIAADALRASTSDETSTISLNELDALLEQKRK